MDFEDILNEVGGFGYYQKSLLFFFMVPAFISTPMFSMNTIFYASTPDHWCYVPEVANSNLSLEVQQMLIRPSGDPSCSMYDVDYEEVIASGNWSIGSSTPTKPCEFGWQYDKSEYDQTAVTKWNMVCKDAHYSSLMLSLVFIGDIVGTAFYGFTSDKFGRKLTFHFLCLLLAVTDIGSVLCTNFILFLVLRFLNGTAMTTVYASVFIILLELVKPDVRTRMNGIATTSWTCGLCMLSLIAYLTASWIKLSIVTSVLAASLLLYWKFLPESPSWLVSRERYSDATNVMLKISRINGKAEHNKEGELLQKIEAFGSKLKHLQTDVIESSPLDFFKYPTLRKRLFLLTVCWVASSVPYFGLQMNVVNLAGSEFFNFFLVSLVEVPAHLLTWYIMENVGRRWCSVGAFTLTGLACMMPAMFPADALVGLIASLVAKLGSSSTYMTLYQQGPEIFPTNLRAVGIGIIGSVGHGSTLFVPYIISLAKYGAEIPFLVFGSLSFISVVCASFLPETLHRKLPQNATEADNFEKDQKFFSLGRISTPEKEPDYLTTWRWTPRRVSAMDMMITMKVHTEVYA